MTRFALRSRMAATTLLALAVGSAYFVGQRQSAEALVRSNRPGMQSALALQETFSSVATDVQPAVVSVQVEKTVREMEYRPLPRNRRWGPFQYYRAPGEEKSVPMGEGSGFIFRSNGYVLTNNHVVDGADGVKVTMHDGRQLPAHVVGVDELLDLAVLKIDHGSRFTAVELGNSDSLGVGQWAIAIGNPFHLGNTFTVGVISAKGRELDSLGGQVTFQNFIQTDASINPGNSGGPLVNIYGEVIGINNAIFSPSGPMGGNVGIGFAIPINNAKEVLDDLVAGKKIVRGYLGVTITKVTPELAREVGSPKQKTGVFVHSILKGGPAHTAGIRPGDIITSLDGKAVKDDRDLSRAISRSGTRTVEVDFVRKGERKTVRVTLTEFPNEA